MIDALLADLPPAALAAAAAAALLVGVAKGGFGGGVGVLATPLVALAMPAADAAALMLPVLIAADVFAVDRYRRAASAPDLLRLLPAATLGVALGALAFEALAERERVLTVAVGALALGFVAWRLRPSVPLGADAAPGLPPSTARALPLGLLAGFGSTLAHVGGPPVAVYLLPRRLTSERFVGTNAWLFFALNLIKLVPYAWLDLLTVGRVGLAAALLPLAWLGVRLGAALRGRVDERAFERIVLAILALTGVQLLLGRDLLGLLAGPR